MQIVIATLEVAGAYKINTAFFERHGQEGISALCETIRFINYEAPQIPVILDAKRGDIGNTNDSYVEMAFNLCRADAVTVHPYLGGEALSPFLERFFKGVVVLCRTSNPGAPEFQDRIVQITDEEADRWGLERGTRMPLYQLVAYRVRNEWNKKSNCALVVGATYPEEIAEVRKIVGANFPLLIPGIGKQGGSLAEAVKAARGNFFVNVSRDISFAGRGNDFADAAGAKAQELHRQIQQHLKEG